MRVYRYITTICCMLFSAVAISQVANTLQERVYLQTDKQLYLAGELAWVKLFTTDATGKPVALSKVAYVELLDESGSLVQAKVELVNGIGEGWLMLPTTLPTRSYRMVAYTRYMKNEGEEVFFSKAIPVVNTLIPDQSINLVSDTDSPFLIILGNNDSNISTAIHSSENNTIEAKTDRSVYSPRSMAELSLSGLPEDIHTLAVSIHGDDAISAEQPYGISEWNRGLAALQNNATFSKKLLPEYEGHILTGKIIDLSTNAPTKEKSLAPLLAFPGNQISLFTGQVDENGTATFYTKRIAGTQEIATAIVSYTGARYRMDIESPFALHSRKPLPSLAVNMAQEEKLLQRSVELQLLYAYRADSLSRYTTEKPLFQWLPDKEYRLDDYTRFPSIGETLTEYIDQARFRRVDNRRYLNVYSGGLGGTFSGTNTLVLLDGIPIINHEIIYAYNPAVVEKISIYQDQYFFGGNLAFDGIVFFKTYKNDYPGLQLDETTQIFDYEGTQNKRIFYAPSYQSDKEKKSRTPDYRHTLLWNPNVETNGESSVTIPFTTSDLHGDFVVVVEGIAIDGRVVSAKTLITVE